MGMDQGGSLPVVKERKNHESTVSNSIKGWLIVEARNVVMNGKFTRGRAESISNMGTPSKHEYITYFFKQD
jgi:hypothetical protein